MTGRAPRGLSFCLLALAFPVPDTAYGTTTVRRRVKWPEQEAYNPQYSEPKFQRARTLTSLVLTDFVGKFRGPG